MKGGGFVQHVVGCLAPTAKGGECRCKDLLGAENTALREALRKANAESSMNDATCACSIPAVEPCNKRCTCRWPHYSGGCTRCASYGSAEQREGMAKAIVAREKRIAELEASLQLAHDELRAIKTTVIATIGGVDYEGYPTSEINYLQRLRILVETEQQLAVKEEELKALDTKYVKALEAVNDYMYKWGFSLKKVEYLEQREKRLRSALAAAKNFIRQPYAKRITAKGGILHFIEAALAEGESK